MLLGIVAGVMAVVALGFAGFTFLSPPPAATSAVLAMPAASSLDQRWGSYLGEREWGTPREAVGNNGWGLSWSGAITTPYNYGDDGICGWSDNNDQFRMGWAFWDGTQDHVTERFNGLSNPAGPAGETDHRRPRVPREHTNACLRPADLPLPDARQVVLDRLRVGALRLDEHDLRGHRDEHHFRDAHARRRLQGWTSDGSEVEPLTNGLLMRGATSYVAIVGQAPSEWQINGDKSALDTNLRAATGLNGDQGGNYRRARLPIADPRRRRRASSALARRRSAFDDVTLAGQREITGGADGHTDGSAKRLHRRRAAHGGRRQLRRRRYAARRALPAGADEHALERDVLPLGRHLGVNPAYAGLLDAHDVLILPDKWEYPWPASWDMAFHSVTASLIDPALAQAQLQFILSNRWQQPDGHIPCSEWVMDEECPPIFAWAAWRVYEQNHDLAFLQSVYPALQRNYDYWWSHNMIGDSLFTGGSLGMDNLPRGGPGQAQADASGWMAFFARDMARIASEVRDPAGSQRYWVDRGTIQQAINTQLWDDQTGFYYDLNTDGSFVMGKSYTGLVPLIAGVVPPERVPTVLSALHDPNQFLSPGGIRSMSADAALYTPGLGGPGVNSNWRGPVWVPINYLLVESLSDVDPSLAEDIRDRVVNNVEGDWRATGRLHEFFDGDTGKGLGADEQAGWTALVANLIRDAWPATSAQ